MALTVYVETSIISYLTARPSREIVTAAHQQLTVDWWTTARPRFNAVASENGADYLLTWNCRHIANARARSSIERTVRSFGYDPPVLCTPEELLEP
jgi:hypothetical protein